MGSSVKLVCSHISSSVSGIHLESTFINPSPKVAVINKILLEISKPNFCQTLKPYLFFKYNSDFKAVCDGPPHSIVVKPRDSHLENIEFSIPGNFIPEVGIYDFKLRVWINKRKKHERECHFQINVTKEIKITEIMAGIIAARQNKEPHYFVVEI